MIEISDTSSDVDVQPAEYLRLLGYPRGWVLEGRAPELADWARDVVCAATDDRGSTHAASAPFASAMTPSSSKTCSFNSTRLRSTLQRAGADRARSGRRQCRAGARRGGAGALARRKAGRVFFSRGVRLGGRRTSGDDDRCAIMCAGRTERRRRSCPHYSPGYPEWAIDEQPSLLELIRRPRPRRGACRSAGVRNAAAEEIAACRLRCHARSSIASVALTELSPCENCSFASLPVPPCALSPRAQVLDLRVAARSRRCRAEPAERDANYSVSLKALQRWSQERLTLDQARRRQHRRALSLRRHDLHQHGTTARSFTIM